jgi:hypothetical protein
MKTTSFLILKHEHFYVMRFMQVGFLALECLLPPTSFHHSSNSSLRYYCYYFTGLQFQLRSNLWCWEFAFGSNNWAKSFEQTLSEIHWHEGAYVKIEWHQFLSMHLLST